MGLEDLTRYESAGVAAMNAKKEPGLAVAAMGDFYQNVLEENDPIISRALQEAMVGGENGISHAGVVQAIQVYGGKYEQAFALTKFSDLINYLSDGYSIPDEVKKGLSIYNESTYMDLAQLMKNEGTPEEIKKEIERAIQAVSVLKDRKLREKTLGLVNDNTTAMLNQLYPKSEKEAD